jgi:hypothetical protein
VAKSKDTVKVKVIGPNAVAGVEAPNTVELDPDRYNIRILVETGQVEAIDKVPEGDPDPVAASEKSAGRKAKS